MSYFLYRLLLVDIYLPSLLSTQNENTCDGQISSTQLGFLPGCAQQFQHASKFTINENNIYDDSDDFGYEMFEMTDQNMERLDVVNIHICEFGGSGGGSFASSDKNRANVVDDANKLECKWVKLEKQQLLELKCFVNY